MAKKIYKPGHKAEKSGQYVNAKTGKEITMVKGKTFPPGPKGSTYVLVNETKH
jgi:hypothetical protein